MKYTYKIKLIFGVALIAVTALSSCESILDQPPTSAIQADQFWRNNIDANSGVIGIYDAMQDTYREKRILWGDYRSDNFIEDTRINSDRLELLNNQIIANNSAVLNWGALYTMINRANLAIANIPNIVNYDPNLLGEAYALRAFAYFDAVRAWGVVPVFTEPTEGVSFVQPTNGAKIMADIILPDLAKAKEFLTNANAENRFSVGSLLALEANINFYLKKYAEANGAIDQIIASKDYELVKTRAAWRHLFLNDPDSLLQGIRYETGPELIFSIKYTLATDGRRSSGIWGLLNPGNAQVYMAPLVENKWITKFPIDSTAWVTKYPTFTPKTKDPETGSLLYGDWRYFETRQEGALIGAAKIAKYNKNQGGLADDDTDIPIYRYADMVLLKALMINRINYAANKTEAIALVNQIRTARQLPNVVETAIASQNQLEILILDERQMELYAEGHRFWDLVQTGRAVEVLGPINGQTEATILLPYLEKHLIDNPKLSLPPL